MFQMIIMTHRFSSSLSSCPPGCVRLPPLHPLPPLPLVHHPATLPVSPRYTLTKTYLWSHPVAVMCLYLLGVPCAGLSRCLWRPVKQGISPSKICRPPTAISPSELLAKSIPQDFTLIHTVHTASDLADGRSVLTDCGLCDSLPQRKGSTVLT